MKMKNLRKGSYLAVSCFIAVLVMLCGRFLDEGTQPDPEAPRTAVRRQFPVQPALEDLHGPVGDDSIRDTVGRDEGALLSLTVFSSESSAGLGGAVIEILGAPDGLSMVTADVNGEASIPIERFPEQSNRLLVINAQGHVRRMVHLQPSIEDAMIGLFPSARLSIEVHDDLGAPLKGIPVLLLPPDVHGKPWGDEWRMFRTQGLGRGPEEMRALLAHAGSELELEPLTQELPFSMPEMPESECPSVAGHSINEAFRDCVPQDRWVRTTNEEGIADWSGIPAMEGYHWSTLAGSVIEFEPARKLQVATRESGLITIAGDRQAEDISGGFELVADEELRLKGVVSAHTGLFGVFPEAAPIEGARVVVQLFDLEPEADSIARGYRNQKMEWSGWADERGFFELREVLPGKKLLRSWWREMDNAIYFADRSFSLKAGEYKDLGALLARSGVPYVVHVKLQDTAGQELNPDTHLHRDRDPELYLDVIGWDTHGDRSAKVEQLITIPVATDVTLQGMPDGRAHFSLDWASTFKGPRSRSARLSLPEDVEVSYAEQDRVELAIELVDHVQQRVLASLPQGTRAIRGEAHLQSKSSGKVYRRDLRPARDGSGVIAGTLDLPAGSYELYAHTHTMEEPDRRESLSFWGDVEVGSQGPISIALEPAASIQGVARDGAGEPRANQLVFLSTGSFAEGRRASWTHRVRTDSRGNFLLRGLLSGQVYVTNSGASVKAGPIGALEEMGIVW